MKALTLVALCGLLVATAASAQSGGQLLPTGQSMTPLAAPKARFEPLVAHVGPYPDYVADGAAAIVVSPDRREMLVLTSGFNRFNGPDGKIVLAQSSQYVFRYSIGPQGARHLQTVTVPNSYSGVAWLPSGQGFVVGGGLGDVVHLFNRGSTGFSEVIPAIPLGHKDGVGADVKPQAAGVAVSPDGRRVLVANYYNDSVSLVDLAHRTVIAERDLRPERSILRTLGWQAVRTPSRWSGPMRRTLSSPPPATARSWRSPSRRRG